MTEQKHTEREARTLHTPGPLSYDSKGINGPDEYRRRLFTARQADDRDDAAMLDAYGHLFAAAPELLAVLVDLTTNGTSLELYTAARIAVAKAEGG